jgi:hypothetical protein
MELGTILTRSIGNRASLRLTRKLQLDCGDRVKRCPSGGSAPRTFQFGYRYVEMSDDVIRGLCRGPPYTCRALFFRSNGAYIVVVTKTKRASAHRSMHFAEDGLHMPKKDSVFGTNRSTRVIRVIGWHLKQQGRDPDYQRALMRRPTRRLVLHQRSHYSTSNRTILGRECAHPQDWRNKPSIVALRPRI